MTDWDSDFVHAVNAFLSALFWARNARIPTLLSGLTIC